MAEINRYHSKPLDVHRWSDHREATKLRDEIWNEYFSDAFPPMEGKGNKAKSAPKKQFKVLLLDLYVAWLDDPELSIGVGMTKTAYKANTRYNALYISAKMIKIINHAHSKGLIDKKTGSEQSGKTTRIRASAKLAAIFSKTDLTLFDLVEECPNREVIILNKKEYRDDKERKVQVDYEDTDFEPIVEMRNQVQRYNSLLWRTHIDIPTREEPYIAQEYWDKKVGEMKTRKVRLTQDNKFVKRVFYRGSWNLGGRFHGGWWQSIKEDWRKQIYINDMSTVEIDYSGLHVNLLYGLQEMEQPQDPYILDEILQITADQQRKIVKTVVLMAINANSPAKAFSAFRQNQAINSIEKSLNNKQLQWILDAFKEKHPTIADSICSDKGVDLMNIDGKITAKIINHFTKKNIPVLTIHDSCVIQNQYSGELRTVMTNVVKEQLNGFKINIEQEGIGVDQIRAFRNMDRANAHHYDYSSVTSYERTTGYIKRNNKHKEWLLTLDN
jgi:hypothetical protein